MAGAWGCALLAGSHQWWFELTGHSYEERGAFWGAGLSVLGFNLAFLPGFVLGAHGLLASSYHYPEALIPLQRVTTAGVGILLVGLLLVVGNLARSLMGARVLSAKGASEA
jgi:cytochrome aa3-600 menaquinol oxidase subunit 1